MNHPNPSKRFVPLFLPLVAALLAAFWLVPIEAPQKSDSAGTKSAVREMGATPKAPEAPSSKPPEMSLENFEVLLPPQQMAKGTEWPVTFPDGTMVTARVKASERDPLNPPLYYAAGDLAGAGTFYLGKNDALGDSDGWFLLYDRPMAWRGKLNAAGRWQLAQTPVGNLTCLPPGQEMASAPVPDGGGGGVVAYAAITPDIPIKESRPGAPNVFFLDFRGGSVTIAGTTTTFNPPVLDRTAIEKVFFRVVEDYAPFNVNVTTDEAKYTAGTLGRKMRCIITDKEYKNGVESPIPGGIGGVASPGTFRSSATTAPSNSVCWVFCNPPSDLPELTMLHRTANAVSHEIGHTLGMGHWGTSAIPGGGGEYYPATSHGSGGDDSWSPLMGQYNNATLVQWSKGEYVNAERRSGGDRTGEDIDIITYSLGGVAFGGTAASALIADDKGNTRATAANLTITGTAPDDGGMVNSATDEDYFKITTISAGRIKLDINPSTHGTNLDAYAELQNAAGTPLASSGPEIFRSALIDVTNQPAGTYYLMVRGNAQNNPATNGWSRYGSLGTYRITGTISGAPNPPEFLASDPPPNGSVGVTYNFNLQATNSPTSYYSTNGSLPPGLLLSGGAVMGTPTQAGVYTLTLAAANAFGGSAKTFTFTIFGSVSLPDSLDNVPLDWESTSPPSSLAAQLWQGQRLITQDGTDAARSGAIGSNAESILSTNLKGPGKLTFYWRTSSHSSDRLIFKLNSTEQFNIGGETAWEQKTVLISGLGTYPVSWIYRTDPGTTAGQNAGFVDRVVYQRTPQFIEGSFYGAGITGKPYFKAVAYTETANSWALTGGSLPPGVNLSAQGQLIGTPSTTGVFSPEITATNDAGASTTYPDIYIFPDVTLATALDGSGLVWTSDGFNPWFGDNVLTHDNTDVARSGPIRHGLETWMQTTVNGPGTLGFWWKCSTETGGDPLAFSIDGVVQDSISGEAAWVQKSYPISSGSHILKWRYSRDGSGNGGSNAAWVDQVSWVTPGPTITSALNVNWTCGQTSLVNLTSDDPNAVWSVTGALPEDVFFLADSKVIGAVPRTPRVVTFTLNATNAGGTGTSRTFTANIESSYAAWARSKGVAPGTANDDPDKDGLTNLAECAFDFAPNVKDPPFQPVTYDAVTQRLRAVFKRRHQYFPDLKYEVQVSVNLQTWQTIAYTEGGSVVVNTGAQSITEAQTNPFPDPVYEVTVTDGTPSSPAVPCRHMRLKVTQL